MLRKKVYERRDIFYVRRKIFYVASRLSPFPVPLETDAVKTNAAPLETDAVIGVWGKRGVLSPCLPFSAGFIGCLLKGAYPCKGVA